MTIPEPRLRAYHFDLGDSTDGPVGFCAVVLAKSKGEALKLLQKRLTDIGDKLEIIVDEARIEYIAIYFNPLAITSKNIDTIWDQI